MSSDIETKIVEIEFQNRNFEKSVKQTQASIQELNKSLQFDGSEKGTENLKKVEKTIRDMRLDDLNDNVQKIANRFSTLGVMGTTALVRISNAAIATGKNLVKSFTIDPVKTGLSEYETQLNSVQTILANTKSKGTNLEQVNAALDELNRYADKTIYNFTEMTRNIGTFTAAGVDLNTSVGAIQGIANLAAVSGSNAQQASTAMYQLSQALAAGRVSLMDWNSVVNAGMGGEVFQQALRETSKALGTGAEAAIAAKGSFRESLQTGWLTADVLTETLKKFTTSGANEWVAEYTGLTKEAVDETLKAAEAQYGEAEAIEEASKQLAEKSGKSQQEIKDVLEMAKTAEDAATKVKTFTQLLDTLKESVQSGWSETWRTVIGDFEEAKELFTGIKDAIDPIISKSAELRNNMLKVWKALGGRAKLLEGLANISNTILGIWNSIYQAFYDVFGIVGKEMYEITNHFVEFTKELVANNKTLQDIKRVVRGFASVLGIVLDIVSAAVKMVFQVLKYLKPVLSAVLHFFAILGDGITILREFLKRSQIFDRVGKAVARTLLLIGQIIANVLRVVTAVGLVVFDTIFYVIRAIVTLYKTIKERFGGIGGFISYEIEVLKDRFPELGKLIDKVVPAFTNFGDQIRNFFGSLKTTFSSGGNILDFFSKIGTGIKSAFEGIPDFLSGIISGVGKVVDSILNLFSGTDWKGAIIPIALLSLLIAGIFKALTALDDVLITVSNAVSDGVKKVSKSISKYLDAKAMNERSQAFLNVAKGVAILAGSLIALTFVDSDKLLSTAIALGVFTAAIMLIAWGLNALTGALVKKEKIADTKMDGLASTLIGMAVSMLIVIKAVSTMQEEMNKTRAYGDVGFGGAIAALIGTFVALAALTAVMTIVMSKWAPDSAEIIKSYVVQLLAVVVALKQLSEPGLNLKRGALGLLAVGIFLVAFLAVNVIASKFTVGAGAWGGILASALALRMVLSTLMTVSKIPTEKLIGALGKSLGVIIAFRLVMRVASTVSGKGGATIGATALAFLALVVAMKILSKMDAAGVKRGTKAMTVMMIPMGILMLISNFGKTKVQTSAKVILAMSGAIAAMALCASLLSLLEPSAMWRGTIAISLMAGIMGGVMFLTKFSNKSRHGIKSMIVMAAIIGVLALSAGLLSKLDLPNLIAALSGIAAVIGMMTLVFLAAKGINSGKASIAMVAMAVPILAIAGALAILGALDIDSSIETTVGLSVLLLAMSVCAKLLGVMPISIILNGCLGLIAIAATLLLVFEMFSLAYDMGAKNGIVKGAKILGDAIGALIGGIIGGIGMGTAAMLPVLGDCMSIFMENIQGFLEGSRDMDGINFGALFALAGLVATLAIVAPLSLTIPVLSGALWTLGKGLEQFIDATEGLTPAKLDHIAKIMEGLGNLAVGMLGFSAYNLKSFGEGLPDLAKNIVEFTNNLLGENGENSLDVDAAEEGAKIFAAFAKVAATVPRTGGMIGAILGDVDLGGFVGAMKEAGPAIKTFHNDVAGLQYSTVEEGLKILEETVRVASDIPNSGGMLGMIAGENNLDAFATMMLAASPQIAAAVGYLKGVKYSDAEEGLKVLKATIDTAQSIPNSGASVVSAFVGDNTLEEFAKQMANAGHDIAEFLDAMPKESTDADFSVYDQAHEAIAVLGAIISVGAGIDTQTWWDKLWEGDNSLTAIGEDLATFGPKFAEFWKAMSGVSITGDEMKKKSEALGAFLDGLAKISGVGEVTLPEISAVTAQDTIYALTENMVTAASSQTNKDNATAAGNTIMSYFADALYPDSAEQAASNMASSFYNYLQPELENNSSQFTGLGEDILDDIGTAFEGDKLKGIAEKLSQGLIDEVEEYLDINSPSKKFEEIGKYIILGLSKGLEDRGGELVTASDNMASTVENQFRDDLGIHSPSTVFEDLGTYIVDGLKNGLSSEGSMDDILGDVLGDVDFTSIFGDYGGDMKNIFSGAFDGVDMGEFSMEGLDDGSFVDSLMAKIQEDMDDQGLTADVEAVFDADALQEQLNGLDGTISTSGTGSIAGVTMDSFANTKFEDSQQSGSGGKNSFNFVQNNYSPTALDRIAIYRQTRNQFAAMKEVVNRA